MVISLEQLKAQIQDGWEMVSASGNRIKISRVGLYTLKLNNVMTKWKDLQDLLANGEYQLDLTEEQMASLSDKKKNKNPNWGGPREGSGRKQKTSEKRVPTSITMKPSVKEKLRKLAKADGVTVPDYIENLIEAQSKDDY